MNLTGSPSPTIASAARCATATVNCSTFPEWARALAAAGALRRPCRRRSGRARYFTAVVNPATADKIRKYFEQDAAAEAIRVSPPAASTNLVIGQMLPLGSSFTQPAVSDAGAPAVKLIRPDLCAALIADNRQRYQASVDISS